MTVLLVEHRMSLVMSICQRVIVLAAGTKIADADPATVQRDPVVPESYLGPASSQMSILSVQGIDVTMGAHGILQGVTLEVAQHAVVSVIGGNGVGKTTLMRAISGIYRCATGTITFRGTPIANLPSHSIVRLGLAQAPEGRMIFSNMTVRENLVLGAGMLPAGEFAGQLAYVLSLFPILAERLRQKCADR